MLDRKEYQRNYARNKYQALTPEERKIRNSSESCKKAKIKYRSNPANRAKENAANREWYKNNKDRKQAVSRLWRYKITKATYEKLITKQNYLCAICNQVPTKKKRLASPDGFAIDHCHNTNIVRGLLCESCNKLLGYAKDSKNILHNAIDYLEKFDANV